MRILISGAGPAGLTLAYWLEHHGFTPTIVERASSLLTSGYKIDVRGKALKILKQMGIYETVVSSSTDMQGALLVDKDGNVISDMSGDEFGHRTGEDIESIRGKLCQILIEKIPDVECIFNDTILGISPSSDEIEVQFKNHPSRIFDLVIGADGLHSNLRKLVFGDEKLFLHNLGLCLCVFTVPNHLNLDRIEMQYTELGKAAAVWSTRGESNMKACFGFVPSGEVHLDDRSTQQEMLRKVYDGIAWEVPNLLKQMPNSSDFYFDYAAQIYMNEWTKERVALVGDAAYCASPMSGQGTSLALIGAYVLAGELRAAKGNYKEAFTEYEKLMRPFIKINQELGVSAAKLMRSQEQNRFTAWLLTKIMSFATGPLIKFFIQRSTQRIHKAANFIDLKDY